MRLIDDNITQHGVYQGMLLFSPFQLLILTTKMYCASSVTTQNHTPAQYKH